MKKVILAVIFLVSLAYSARSQGGWTPVNGKYSYALIRFDSLTYWKGGPTSTRPAPISGTYWLRYNTDNGGFEYSDGTKWTTFSKKPPADTTIDVEGRDTTLILTCGIAPGTYPNWPYLKINLPQYIGFRVRLNFSGGFVISDLEGFCTSSMYYSGPSYYSFDSSTGDLYIYGIVGSGAGSHNVFIIGGY